jgi:hypothetical protein
VRGETSPEKAGSEPYWNRWYWIPTLLAVVGFAFLWALALLTYLLPPFEIYHNLLNGTLTRNQSIFLTAATIAFTVEFLLARHFFCRYVCAVGLFQSLAWMANDRAMVVGFDTRRAAACADCDNACDHACPMRLKPRTIKRKMFTCTECAECISACTQVQHGDPQQSLLRWVEGAEALPVVTGRPSADVRRSKRNAILPGICHRRRSRQTYKTSRATRWVRPGPPPTGRRDGSNLMNTVVASRAPLRLDRLSTQRLSADRWKNKSEHSGIAPSPVSRSGGTPLRR